MRLLTKISTLITVLLLMTLVAGAQTSDELKQQKKKNQKELNRIKEILKQAQQSKSLSENKLNLINKNIEIRQEQLAIISTEIELIEEKIVENTEVIESLEKDLKKLKDQYAKMIYYAYKNKDSYHHLMFIMAADDFNQAYKRLQYIKQYSEYRKKQITIIKITQDMLNRKVEDLEKIKAEKLGLVKEKQTEASKLNNEKKQQASEITKLKRKENDLKKKLASKRKEAQRIDRMIKEAIRKEQEKIKATSAGNLYESLTAPEKIVSDQLGANKGGLPWPTERGVITVGFGKQKHPVLDVYFDNSGVDISTTQGALVRAVFEGKVIQIITLPTGTKAVLMQHGVYFTLYSNLKEVYVVVGDQIERKQSLGIAYTDPDDNKTTVHFEIWKEFTKMNPALWLARK